MPIPRSAHAEGISTSISIFTFEAGGQTFAVRSGDVRKILAPGQPPPDGLNVVDILGLLEPVTGAAAGPAGAHRGYLIILAGEGSEDVAVTASRVGEVADLPTRELMPVPGYLFRGENPFLGLVAAPAATGGKPVFLLGGPDRVLAAAGSL